MKRRDFLTAASLAGVAVSAGSTQVFAQNKGTAKQLIELQTYTTDSFEKKEQLIKVFDEALIPALNRQGIKPVGIFWTNKELNDGSEDYQFSVFVIIPHSTENSVVTCTQKLLADKEYMKAAAPIFDAPVKNPLYSSCESVLMLGFELCPTVEVPTLSADRVAQLRFYKSYNIERNAAKVHMFDEGGELPLFRKCGMNPVFFGETLVGGFMPNLTYMLSFENETARKAGWKAFVESAEWNEMKNRAMYKDTATAIINVLLKPSPKSQI